MRFPRRWSQERAASLKVLRMRDYTDYLASPLWAGIRRRVYARAKGCCEVEGCTAVATAIHHWSYALKVMRGATLKGLQAVCEEHHQRAHRRVPKSPQQEAKRAQRRALRDLIATGGAIRQPSKAVPRLVKRTS